MRKFFLVSSAIAALMIAAPAGAADLRVKAQPMPPPAPVFSWTGFYVGGHIGAGWARKEWTDTSACGNFEGIQFPIACSQNPSQSTAGYVGEHNAKGLLGGVQAGYNWQTGVIVWGIEAQYSWSDLKGDHQDTRSQVSASEDFEFWQPIQPPAYVPGLSLLMASRMPTCNPASSPRSTV
jgi:outer membrane immunogenic protein